MNEELKRAAPESSWREWTLNAFFLSMTERSNSCWQSVSVSEAKHESQFCLTTSKYSSDQHRNSCCSRILQTEWGFCSLGDKRSPKNHAMWCLYTDQNVRHFEINDTRALVFASWSQSERICAAVRRSRHSLADVELTNSCALRLSLASDDEAKLVNGMLITQVGSVKHNYVFILFFLITSRRAPLPHIHLQPVLFYLNQIVCKCAS